MPAPLSQPSPTLLSALPALYLYPLNDSFVPKHIALSTPGQRVKIGRQTNAKTAPGERNGYFDSKVLSRAHAEIWEDGGKIYIKDVKSSNGTFINGERLSPEGIESDPFGLNSDDIVEFGIDIVGEDNKTIIHHKVAARVICIFSEQDALMAARSEQQHMPASSMHPSSLASSSNGQQNMAPMPSQPKSSQFPPQRLTGMGGMGGSMRPPGKSGLTFEHILTRLQGELQKSRDTGAELGALTGAMGEIGDTLGGALPPNAPSFPNPSSLPPVRPPPPADEQPAPLPETDTKSSTAVDELTEKLQDHEQKVRILEDKLKEQEGMWNEIRGMLLAKQRAEDEEREYHQQQRQERDRQQEENDYDDDDARSIATVTGGLEPVDEEEEPEEDFSHHEQALENDQDHEQDHDDERKQEHLRPRTPEPSLALQSQAPEPEPVAPQPDYGSLIAELTLKVSQLTEQLVESRGVIRGLEEKVASLSMTPTTPPPAPNMDWMDKWEEMARRVGRVEESVEKVKETETERANVEDVLPPSPRSLSSDSMRQRRRGRSSSVRREAIETLTEVIKTNGVANGGGELVKKENGEIKVKDPRRSFVPPKDTTMTTLGIVILSAAAVAVIWKVKE